MTISLETQIRAKLEQHGYQVEPSLERRIAAVLKDSLTPSFEGIFSSSKGSEPKSHRLFCLGTGEVAVVQKKN